MLCQGEPLISLEHVSMGWDGRRVLEDVSLTVGAGDFIAITGPNGGGKTTLLRLVLGLLHPVKGKIIKNFPSLKIGYLPQKNMIDSRFPVSVKEVVMSGLLGCKGLDDKEKKIRYDAVIDEMGLADHSLRPIGQLSGGQLQRALLGRALISNPELLVLDEPLSYIDKRFESRLYHIIAGVARHSTIILVSHEMSVLGAMANRHYIVDGRLHACTALTHTVKTDCNCDDC
ncbi:MAG: ATP-binding cassette domain-containing protein [Muribaculaceae bacterium]|nr:ATP-binding cassette domain-containing protein [Muribaculaceae bacterium]